MINKKIIIVGVLLFIFPVILAQEIQVNYPNEVNINEEFLFKIKLIGFDVDTYDIKIDIMSNDERIAKILNNGEWKSTYYYVNDIIQNDEEKEFSIRIAQEFENADILIKIKDSESKSNIFSGYVIKKKNSESVNKPEQNNETDEKILEPEQNNFNNSENNESEILDAELETINLYPKDIKSENHTSKVSDYALYGFIIFSILIIFLIILKKIKSDKNEFR